MSKKAAVFILLGQSNAVGHSLQMDEKDIIRTPLANVYGLHRDDNQSFDIPRLVWRNYISAGMNLGETQDNTYSLTNCLAAAWQKKIDEGEALPDLYLINISVGAQGITEKFMWYPYREKKLIPGPLGTADISLYPLTMHILSLLDASFAEIGKTYEIIGIHWRGGEEEMVVKKTELEKVLPSLYHTFITDLHRVTSSHVPVILHRIVCPGRAMDESPDGSALASMNYVDDVFDLTAKSEKNVSVYDPRIIPFYEADTPQHGIFKADKVHFTREANEWIVNDILSGYEKTLRKRIQNTIDTAT